MSQIEVINHRGHRIEVCYDEEPMSPREWDNLGTMIPCLGEFGKLDTDWKRFLAPLIHAAIVSDVEAIDAWIVEHS